MSMAGFHDRDLPPAGHRLVPHPAVTLVLDFGAGPPLVDDARGHRFQGSLVAGLGLGNAVRVQGSAIESVQIRLSPVVAGQLLGLPLGELSDRLFTLDDLWGRDAPRVCERLHQARSWEERFTIAEEAMVIRRADIRPIDREVAWAWSRIVTRRGRARVDRLADELGWSRKRLWSRFGAQIGVPPKFAARLVRFDDAAHRLAAGHPAARVAADCSYTDQAHLHRDITSFVDVTPTRLSREPFLSVDDQAWPARRP